MIKRKEIFANKIEKIFIKTINDMLTSDLLEYEDKENILIGMIDELEIQLQDIRSVE